MNLTALLSSQGDAEAATTLAANRKQIGRDQHQAWLKEMERARARHAQRPAHHSSRVSGAGPSVPSVAPLKSLARPFVRPAFELQSRSPSASRAPADSAPAAAAADTPPAMPRWTDAALNFPAPPQPPTAPPPIPAAAGMARGAIAAALAERLRWPLRHTFVLEQGGAVRVWVRDASIEAIDDVALFSDVAHALRALGFRLATLTVNGREGTATQP